MDPGAGTNGIELSDLIWQLRHDLSRAMWAGENADLRFEAGPIQLEVSVIVERATSPSAKVRLVVLEAEAEVRRASTAIHKISMTLHPRRAGELDRSPLISGAHQPGER